MTRENEVSGIVPVLARLSGASDRVEKAYYCHPSVQHIFKQENEGGFCGYRNIQMVISYVQGAKINGYNRFGHDVPDILQLQDMIEAAWDRGISEHAKQDTGGIRGTRKWIGTPEV